MIAFIDCEISGFRAYDQIIEFALVQLESGYEYSTFVYGAENITPDLGEVHKITPSMISENSISFEEVCRQVNLTDPSVVYASYNFQFDIDWMNHTLLMEGGTLPPLMGICLMEVVEKIVGHRLSLDDAFQRFVPEHLKSLQEIQTSTSLYRHRALFDCEMHKKLFVSLTKIAPVIVQGAIKKFESSDI